MTEQLVNCDLRCGSCTSGIWWDGLVSFINGHVTAAATAVRQSTGVAELAIGAGEPAGPVDQAARQALTRLGEAALTIVTEEAALRSTLTGELERIGQIECGASSEGRICRIEAVSAAGSAYIDGSLGLASAYLKKMQSGE